MNDKYALLQKEINHKLEQICSEVKNISNRSNDYLEYISALIFVLYKNRKILKQIIDTKEERLYGILKWIDGELENIRIQEKSHFLFINVNFTNIDGLENSKSIFEVILDLSDLILQLDKLVENSKEILAEAFDNMIMKESQENDKLNGNGEFYTPKEVVKTMVKLANIKEGYAIYNPASETGNFITESAKQAKIYSFGEENNLLNYDICITNLWLHDISDKRIGLNYEKKVELVDIAIANPPFTETGNTSGYIKYIDIMLKSTHKYGKVICIVPRGFLFKQTSQELYMRKRLLNDNYIEAIINLPEKLFYNTKIPVVILILKKRRNKNNILFIDASKEYAKKRKFNFLTEEMQDKIINTYRKYEILPNYSNVVDIEKIKENGYDLNIKLYVENNKEKENINPEEIKEELLYLKKEQKNIDEEIHNLIKKIIIYKKLKFYH